MNRRFPTFWLDSRALTGRILAPLGCFVAWLARRRFLAFRHRTWTFPPVPVIVIGNIFVGGTGKTPLTIWLCRALVDAGYRPAVLTRGYRGNGKDWPVQVSGRHTAADVGDEAVLLAERCPCPVIAGPDRAAGAEMALRECRPDVLVLDDGLQHYRIRHDLEWCVVDAKRGHGNGRCLPAGPLREPVSRLEQVDLILSQGGDCASVSRAACFSLVQGAPYRLDNPSDIRPWAAWQGVRIHAVAGLGDPDKFFDALEAQGLTVIRHGFPDHHPFAAEDLAFGDELPVVMTEKDAVKCRRLNVSAACWVVPVDVSMPEASLTMCRDSLSTIGIQAPCPTSP